MSSLFDLDSSITEVDATRQKLLKKANSLCAREEFDRALAIYNEILDEDAECLEAHLGILKVHSDYYTVYDSPEIEKDIRVINRLFDDVEDEDYIDFLIKRKKHLKTKEEESAPKTSATPKASAPKTTGPKLSENDVAYVKAFATIGSVEFIWDLEDKKKEELIKTLTPYAEAGFLKAWCGIVELSSVSNYDVPINKALKFIDKIDVNNIYHLYLYTSLASHYGISKKDTQKALSILQILLDAGYNYAYALMGERLIGYPDHDFLTAIEYYKKYLDLPYKEELRPHDFINPQTWQEVRDEVFEDDYVDDPCDTISFYSEPEHIMSTVIFCYRQLVKESKDKAKKEKYESLEERWTNAFFLVRDDGYSVKEALEEEGLD